MVEAYGGQAVIEGVMMRNKSHYAIAVRKPNGKIHVKKEKIKSATHKYSFLKWPFIRGVVALFEMTIIGIKALMWSANQQAEEEDEKLSKKELVLSFVLALGFSIFMFVALPLLLTKLITTNEGLVFNLIDGLFRLGLFLGYIFAISFMKDIRTVFEYHGAEHKTVYCYEHKLKLTPKNADKFSTLHPRCGTSFIVIVIGISIVVFSLIQDPRWWVLFLSRILFLPVIAGIGFEVLKFSAKYTDNFLVKLMIAPGLAVQRITTRPPNKKQLEVAIAAINALL